MAILSFAFKPNPVHRLVESLFIGSMAGYTLVTNFEAVFKTGIAPLSTDPFLLIPLVLGILMYFRLSRKYSWVSNYSMAFLTAIGIGITTRTIVETDIIKQISSTAIPLTSFNNIVLVISVVTVISYFFYTKEHTGSLGISAKLGMAFMMVAFGASVANSFMTRVGQNISFLRETLLFPSSTYMIPIMVIVIAISIYPEKFGLKKR
ncbi:MAG: hypothetical protein KKB59_18600 [Spirochaetes bacterium]|nr:hypothetical protein [Spirochaetota bacterium]